MDRIYLYYVYILTTRKNTVLYVGVTNDLYRRCLEHKTGKTDGFTKKYNVNKLVYYETYNGINEAIAREKQIKGLLRNKKNDLISSTNPEWKELSPG
jgi:putative endonuclease